MYAEHKLKLTNMRKRPDYAVNGKYTSAGQTKKEAKGWVRHLGANTRPGPKAPVDPHPHFR